MKLQQMPNCCGCYLITDFGHSNTNGADPFHKYDPTIQEVSNYLEKTCKNSQKMYTAFLDENQRQAIGKALVDFGFKRRTSYRHPAHNSIVHQYVYIPKELQLKAADLEKIK